MKLKESHIDWLGKIPQSWDTLKLKHIFRINKRIAGKLGFKVLSITQKGIKVKDIKSGDGQLSMDYSKYQLVYPNDFAMNHMDLLTGYVDISNFEGVTSPDYRVFTIQDESRFYGRYYLYLMQMGYKEKLFFHLGQGSSHFGRWRLPTLAFREIEYPVPPLEEQTQIANFLDHETAKIDKLITKQQVLIELFKEKIMSIAMDEQIYGTGDLIRLRHITQIMSRSVSINDNEEYIALGLYNRGRGLFHKPRTLGKDMGDSDFFYITEGDLILSGQFAWEGAVTMASQSENSCVASHRYSVIRGTAVCTEYLLALLMTNFGNFLLNESSRGSAGRNRPLNVNLLLNEKIRIPSQESQDEVRKLLRLKSNLETKVFESLALLKKRRTAVISSAVTGKIDVRNREAPTAKN